MTSKRRSASVRLPPGRVGQMRFYILTPHKIDAHEHDLAEFIVDDLLEAMQSDRNKIAVDDDHLDLMENVYPGYHKYEVIVGRK